MQTIFEELNRAFPTVRGMADSELRLSALSSVEEFIDSGVWWNNASSKEFLDHYRLPVKVYAEKTGRNPNSIRSTLSRSSTRIRERIGFDNITKIVGGTKEDVLMVIAKIKVAMNEVNLDKVVLPVVLSEVKSIRPSKEYNLNELTREVKFLRKYSPKGIENELEELDMDKLAYIVKLLKSNEGALLSNKCLVLSSISPKHG